MKIIFVLLVAVASLVLGTSYGDSFSEELKGIFTNEKCGISINYPEDWEAEAYDYKIEGLKGIVQISPDPDEPLDVDVSIRDISDFREKSIEYVSDIFRPTPDEIETEVIQDDIIQVGGFPSQKLVYIQGNIGEYEFKEDKNRILEINILAYDRVYRVSLEAENQKEFYKFVTTAEDIANSIKITTPNFDGVKC